MSQNLAERFEKIKAIYADEQARRPVVTNINDVPVAYELISDEWLTSALCTKVPGAKVTAHTLDTPDEGTSNRRRIFLQYNDIGTRAALPASIFCKATQSLQSRYVLGLNRSIEAETLFYRKVRPVLDIEAPVGLFANANTESLNSILLMADMDGQVEFCDHKTPVSLARATSQVELLAKVHGTFYSNPQKQKLIETLIAMKPWCDLTQEAFDWSASRVRGFAAGEAVIPPRLYQRAAEVEAATGRSLASHEHWPATLVHNDVHLKNWYVAAEGHMGLSDWQVCVKGCGIRDLAYVISTSLTTDDRRKWEIDLIKHYLDHLAAAGAAPLTFDQTLLVYRQQLFAALAMWTSTLTPAPGSPEMQPAETSLEFIKRMSHAIDDHDALSAI